MPIGCVVLLLLSVPQVGTRQDPVGEGKPLSEWTRLARSGNEQARRNALWAIGQMGADAAPAVPLVIEMLKEQPYTLYAIRALGDLGPTAAAGLPALSHLLEQELAEGEDAAYIWEIPVALARIGAPANSTIHALLRDKRALARQVALVALREAEELTPDDRRAVERALRDRRRAVREVAREVLETHSSRH